MRYQILSATLLLVALGFQGSGIAQAPSGVAFATTSFSAAGEPRGIAVADFDGDGWPDIATANLALNGGSQSGIAVFVNNRNGTFGGPTTIATGAGAFDLIAADVNRDGRQDLAVANADANNVTILLGSDSGFSTAFTWSTSASPRALVAGDFTRDGHVDLAVAAYGCNCVNIGAGAGDGAFTTVNTFDVGTNPEAIAADDFNQDGTLDLYVPTLSRTDTTHFGRGDGTFALVYTTTGIRARDIDVADFNRDGRPDVVRAGDSLVQLQPPYTPHFVYSADVRGDSRGVVTFDVNADSWPDVATASRTAGGIEVMVNIPRPFQAIVDFQFPWPRFATGAGARAITAADVDVDGREDLIVANQSARTVSVLRNLTPRAPAITAIQ